MLSGLTHAFRTLRTPDQWSVGVCGTGGYSAPSLSRTYRGKWRMELV